MSDYVIETKNLTKQYGTQMSVSDLNIHVKKGRIYGLLGRNGAGKTTTMKMLLGLTAPTSGEVEILGKNIRTNSKQVLPHIGSLIEAPGFYPNLTGTENLRIFAELRNIKNANAIKGALELVGLPYRDKKLFSQYSLGMKQRLAIALAVMHNPSILILDEPINGLDPIGIAEVRSFIRELCDAQGKTILISSHILSEIALLADDIGIIDHGVLLVEESLTELENKNRHYATLTEYIRDIIVPDMQKKLRQGFGRAIRTESDTCVVSILDHRAVAGGRYHEDVLCALPACQMAETIEDVETFIRRQKCEEYYM